MWIEEYRFDGDEKSHCISTILDTFERLCIQVRSASSPKRIERLVITDAVTLEVAWANASKTLVSHDLTEEEHNLARFVIEGLIRRWLQDTSGSRSDSSKATGTWTQLLTLQSSESHLLGSNQEEILISHIRVYRHLLHYFPIPSKNNTMPSLLQGLQGYLATPDATRGILMRHHSNAFGIWERLENEHSGSESEMLGYGIWVGNNESMFNHGAFCLPGVFRQLMHLRLCPKCSKAATRPFIRVLGKTGHRIW